MKNLNYTAEQFKKKIDNKFEKNLIHSIHFLKK